MDLLSRNYNFQDFEGPPPPNVNSSHPAASHSSFPVVAVAMVGISAAAFLLVSYHVLVVKCCLNWRFRGPGNNRRDELLVVYSPPNQSRGLDETAIGSIPTVRYSFEFVGGSHGGGANQLECAVCLNEFREEEKLKRLPGCNHMFHIDCVDVWLQGNANCPLCRTEVSRDSLSIADTANVNFAPPVVENSRTTQEQFVVLEFGNEDGGHRSAAVSSEEEVTTVRKWNHALSRGDECIGTRSKDEQFLMQPIRRSFSLDSCTNPLLVDWIHEIARQSSAAPAASATATTGGEECSSRVRRSLVLFRHFSER